MAHAFNPSAKEEKASRLINGTFRNTKASERQRAASFEQSGRLQNGKSLSTTAHLVKSYYLKHKELKRNKDGYPLLSKYKTVPANKRVDIADPQKLLL